jgi:protein ImuB
LEPTAGIVLLRIIPEEVRHDTGRQLDLWGVATDRDLRASRAIARVQAVLGSEEVKTAGFKGGRGLYEQFQLVPWGSPREHEPILPWPGSIARPYPALVYEPPLEADLIDDRGISVSVDARGLLERSPAVLVVSGRSAQPVDSWAGPWPLEERWWSQPRQRRRARMQVIVARGEAHLVFRESARWWLEATYA